MAIVVNLDIVLATKRITLKELSRRVKINMSNLSVLKSNKAKAIRFSTLSAICRELDCSPSDLLEYVPD